MVSSSDHSGRKGKSSPPGKLPRGGEEKCTVSGVNRREKRQGYIVALKPVVWAIVCSLTHLVFPRKIIMEELFSELQFCLCSNCFSDPLQVPETVSVLYCFHSRMLYYLPSNSERELLAGESTSCYFSTEYLPVDSHSSQHKLPSRPQAAHRAHFLPWLSHCPL